MKIQYCSDLHLEFHENLRMMNAKDRRLRLPEIFSLLPGMSGIFWIITWSTCVCGNVCQRAIVKC
jgi:hypothetical protein